MIQDIYDVVIVGGGPAGSTVAALLKKYRPSLRVLVTEKEKFPRDHVGESQLPSISPILDEMGVWQAVEAAGFPIKIGASYTWGASQARWDFDFFPVELWEDRPRPDDYEGQRRFTAFQVDRAIYDQILLTHASDLGAEVHEQTRVERVKCAGDRVTALILADGRCVTGRYFVDASGVSGLFKRALGIGSEAPMALRNIAIWDYWENADWAVEIGTGGTRVQVRSLSYGWIWFIPLGPTRTSIGLICPAAYYKQSGKSPESLYAESLRNQPEIARLIRGAHADGKVRTAKDWSHLADRLVGENWFLCGESAGFADPILAAGMSLAHASARHVAYTILELERGEHDSSWLKRSYDERNRANIGQHIRFAQYWYSANGCFSDLQDYCRAIADEAGLSLEPDAAWRWLSQGGFTSEQLGLATFGSFDVFSAKQLLERFDPDGNGSVMLCNGKNQFRLDVEGAQAEFTAHLQDGHIMRIPCYRREGKMLPLVGYYGALYKILMQAQEVETIVALVNGLVVAQAPPDQRGFTFNACIQALETMVDEGWVKAEHDPSRPTLQVDHAASRYLRSSEETAAALDQCARTANVRFNI